MFCRNCGKEISDESYTCPNCGYLVATPPLKIHTETGNLRKEKIIFCTNCGKEVDEKAYVCIHCGCLIEKRPTPAPLPPLRREPTPTENTLGTEKILILITLSFMILGFIMAIFLFIAGAIIFGISILIALFAFTFSCVGMNRHNDNLFVVTLPLVFVSILATVCFSMLYIATVSR